MWGQVEKGSIHPVVRAIAPDNTSPIPASPVYYLAPTPAQQSVEVSRELCGLPKAAPSPLARLTAPLLSTKFDLRHPIINLL
jgi:hypothetical protein